MLGKKYKNNTGQIGTIEDIRGVLRLVVRREDGSISQTINLKDIDLNKFEEVKEKKDVNGK